VKILVTGGAGFIGGHTADKLVEEGHEVVVIDSLRPPVHMDSTPDYLPDCEFHHGDVRDRALMSKLLARVDAVFHFAAYQDYLNDFSTFFDVNACGTALIYELALEKNLDLQRVVVASSQAVLGEGLYVCSSHGDFCPAMRSADSLASGRWDISCAECGAPAESGLTNELVHNPQNPYGISKYSQELLALNLGRRYGVDTVALRYSIVQGPRQSVRNAYSGACRIFSLAYKMGVAPPIYEDGLSQRDYVNIEDVVAANLLVLSDRRAINRCFNVSGGKTYTVLEIAEMARQVYASDNVATPDGHYRYGDTRHITSDISELGLLGWTPEHSPAKSLTDYAAWIKDVEGIDNILADAMEKMKHMEVVRKVKF
jgi:dTDP-L-rhamnose 4-epimerase